MTTRGYNVRLSGFETRTLLMETRVVKVEMETRREHRMATDIAGENKPLTCGAN